jgi:hypothetical protein
MHRWTTACAAGLLSLALTSPLALAAPKTSVPTPTLEPWERVFCDRIGGVAASAARDRERGWALADVLRRLEAVEMRTGADPAIRNVFAEIAMEVYALPRRSPESWQRIWTSVCHERMLATTGQR